MATKVYPESNTTAEAIARHKMEYRKLGDTGLYVSVLSLGAWVTYGGDQDIDTAYECMKTAYDAGVNFFDNAEVYGYGNAEIVMGEVIRRAGWRRSDLIISTKIFFGARAKPGINDRGLSRKHIIEGFNDSLERLGLEYVDLVYCHRPDPNTPIEETVRAMNYIISTGKAFYWGTSEWSKDEIVEAINIAKDLKLIPPQFEQPQYSLLHRTRFEQEYNHLFKKYKMGTTIWSPLASGLLTGKYTRDLLTGNPPPNSRLAGSQAWLLEGFKSGKGLNGLETTDPEKVFTAVEKLQPIAAELGCTLAQLAIAWTIINPNVSTVITGASRPSQVIENMKALEISKKLTPEIIEKIEAAVNNKPKVN